MGFSETNTDITRTEILFTEKLIKNEKNAVHIARVALNRRHSIKWKFIQGIIVLMVESKLEMTFHQNAIKG